MDRGEEQDVYLNIFLCLGVVWWLNLSIAHGDMVHAIDRTLDWKLLE